MSNAFHYELYRMAYTLLNKKGFPKGDEIVPLHPPRFTGDEESIGDLKRTLAMGHVAPEKMNVENLGGGVVCLSYKGGEDGCDSKSPSCLWRLYVRVSEPLVPLSDEKVDELLKES